MVTTPARSLKGTWPQAIRAFLLPLVLILAARWALMEPYVIPSGSMIPNLLVNDHLFVKKFSLGLRLPFTDRWLLRWREPEAGEILVFRYPRDPSVFYVKRLIGRPGDLVEVRDGRIRVNGREWGLVPVSQPGENGDFAVFMESLPDEGKQSPHRVQFLSSEPQTSNWSSWTVPEGAYFFMGDNRDQSSDGRVWGFVEEKDLIGPAWIIWLSCDEMLESAKFLCHPGTLRWSRMMTRVHP